MSTAAAKSAAPLVEMVHIDRIKASPSNPRKTFTEIDELAEDIAKRGLLQPVMVRPIGNLDYELVFGERRWRAAKKAKLDAIPAFIRDLSDQEALELQIVENAKRSDIHPVEEAEAYRELHEKHGLGVEEIAAKVGKSKRVVYERMQLTALAAPVKLAALEGKLPASHAVLIARVPVAFQEEALKKILQGHNDYGDAHLMSHDTAHDFIIEEYTLGLAEAPWDLKDDLLVVEAGSCAKCPKRTGNQPELFADVKVKDTCTDPGCFAKKKKAFVGLTIAKAKDEGKPVIATAAETKKALKSGAYVDLDARVNGYGETYREALGKKKVETTLAPAPEGLKHLVRKEDLEKALPKKAEAPQLDWQKEDEKRRADSDRKHRIAYAVVVEVHKKAESKSLGKAVWFIVASALLDQELNGGDGAEAVIRALLQREPSDIDGDKDIVDARTAAAKMNAEQLQALVVTVVAAGAAWPHANNGTGALAELAAVLGIDEKKIADQVKAELKAAGKPGHVPPEPGAELPESCAFHRANGGEESDQTRCSLSKGHPGAHDCPIDVPAPKKKKASGKKATKAKAKPKKGKKK